MSSLAQGVSRLNSNLERFDKQATGLAKTANRLTIGLLVFAGLSAFAAIVQAVTAYFRF